MKTRTKFDVVNLSFSGQLDSMESVPDLQKAMIIKFIDGYPFVRLLNLSGTTKAGTHDLESCLKEETCLPLGGYRDSTAQVSVASPNEDELIAMANALSGANVFPPIERENNSTVTVPKAEISNMAFLEKGIRIVVVPRGAHGVFLCSKGGPIFLRANLEKTKPFGSCGQLYKIVMSSCPPHSYSATNSERDSHLFAVHFPRFLHQL
ncbi:hypothetical protein CJ030_MR2G027142 [Morella rubra]|uniref:Uncharacterized protein n=1 Tax=Morella rubra TaxID=262757 RepID=A0A6A1W9E7_9ROSI|nr:hypothetical protein CJ030_MR2G027142 [Morella rubra]